MADISKITIESGTYDIKDAEAREKLQYYTPEEYGAVGDGTTDDTQALQDMFDAIEDTLPTEPSDYQNKDWSGVRIIFSKKYAVSAPIMISNSYGLVLDKLVLIALNTFVGDCMLGFDSGTRELTIQNSIINGSLRVNKCIFLDDYSLVFRVVNCHITRFAQYGIYLNDDQGHEIIINKCKINQVEWGERNNLPTLVSAGTGVYFGTARHDSYMSNTVVNYCRDYSLYINGGGSNFITDCHFYWSDIVNNGTYNFIKGCYFDGTQLQTLGHCYIDGNFFSSDDGTPFIKFIDTYSNAWRYANSYINNNVFRNNGSSGSITNPLEWSSSWSGHESEFSIETVSNFFYNCPTFMYRSNVNYFPEQWKSNIWSGNQAYGNSGTCQIGDLLIQWGRISASGQVNFTKTYALAPFSILFHKTAWSDKQALANGITTGGFYANQIDVATDWISIGRV